MMVVIKKKGFSALSLLGGVLLAASCGGKSEERGAGAGTGGESTGDGDTGDGDGVTGDGDSGDDDVGDGDIGDGDVGDGDGDQSSGGGTGGQSDGVGGDGSSDGGTSAGGSTDAVGGDTGSGGDISGTGGEGTGGDAGTVTTATLGDPCGSPGAFACAEGNPKLALICGGDGEWEFRETCAGDALCDSYEGSGLGTCRLPLPECGAVTGAFCDDEGRVVECVESGFETRVLEVCTSGYTCMNGLCAEVDDPCPEPSLYNYNCSGDECGGKPGVCVGKTGCENAYFGVTLYEGLTATVRTPIDELCSLAECDKPYYQLIVPSDNSPELGVRYRIGPGWGMVPFENGVGDFCGDVVERCIVIPPLLGGSSRGVTLIPLSENPVIRNVTIDLVPAGTTCD